MIRYPAGGLVGLENKPAQKQTWIDKTQRPPVLADDKHAKIRKGTLLE